VIHKHHGEQSASEIIYILVDIVRPLSVNKWSNQIKWLQISGLRSPWTSRHFSKKLFYRDLVFPIYNRTI